MKTKEILEELVKKIDDIDLTQDIDIDITVSGKRENIIKLRKFFDILEKERPGLRITVHENNRC